MNKTFIYIKINRIFKRLLLCFPIQLPICLSVSPLLPLFSSLSSSNSKSSEMLLVMQPNKQRTKKKSKKKSKKKQSDGDFLTIRYKRIITSYLRMIKKWHYILILILPLARNIQHSEQTWESLAVLSATLDESKGWVEF